LKELWNKISVTGIDHANAMSARDRMRIIFFNQVLMVGFFVLLLQVFIAWAFIGIVSLYFLLVSVASVLAFGLNKSGHFWWSKRLFLFTVYGVGMWSTSLMGGAGLYHIGAVCTFAFSLILLDYRREFAEILIGLVLTVVILLIGEVGLFNPPDFSDHENIQTLRFISVANILVLNSIFTVFVIRLNDKNELKLEGSKLSLEQQVEERTMVLSAQKQELVIQNKEKEVLLKEVHHRVNNNLQIIVSLINLQVSKTENRIVNGALHEIQSRVLSMALVHKKMYQTANFTTIRFQVYLAHMIENISTLYEGQDAEFELNVDEDISFELERAIPLGLIFNEIITNFFKHVFEHSTPRSSFAITSFEKEEGTLVFRYSDNGQGFEASMEGNDDSSLGLQLIQSLSEQISGDFRYYSDNGAIYELTLKR
jgi:two-component sensor histidine kinase